MNNLSDNKIINALECCIGKSDCLSCPCEKGASIECLDDLHRYALDLINRQKAEIERLERSAKQWEDTAKDLYISRENIKAEAVKECIEKIKTRSSSCVASKGGIVIAGSRTYTISEVKLYEIKKEMVGEG